MEFTATLCQKNGGHLEFVINIKQKKKSKRPACYYSNGSISLSFSDIFKIFPKGGVLNHGFMWWLI
jgi:hypothetical protein